MPAGAYRIAAVGAQVGIGVADSVHLSIAAIGKENGASAPYCIPNELICSEIGRFLRLPLPPSGIVTSPARAPMFASLNFNLLGVSLPPVNPPTCARLLPDLSTGLLLFDILVGNSDRHPGNLSMDVSTSPPTMNVFDHSHALLGNHAGAGETRLTSMAGRLAVTGGPLTRGNRHFLLDVVNVDTYFPSWIARITKIPDFIIEGVCADAAPFGITPTEATAAQKFLKQRRDNISDLITGNRAEFRAITTWSMI